MKKDLKTVDQLLNEIQQIKKEVIDYQEQSQRLIDIKDAIIDVLEKQKAIYRRDFNILCWVVFILFTILLFVFFYSLI